MLKIVRQAPMRKVESIIYGNANYGGEKNAMRMDQLAKMMGKYSKDHLSQLADLDIPMVSKVAKELL